MIGTYNLETRPLIFHNLSSNARLRMCYLLFDVPSLSTVLVVGHARIILDCAGADVVSPPGYPAYAISQGGNLTAGVAPVTNAELGPYFSASDSFFGLTVGRQDFVQIYFPVGIFHAAVNVSRGSYQANLDIVSTTAPSSVGVDQFTVLVIPET